MPGAVLGKGVHQTAFGIALVMVFKAVEKHMILKRPVAQTQSGARFRHEVRCVRENRRAVCAPQIE
jgi:hypothetical protein